MVKSNLEICYTVVDNLIDSLEREEGRLPNKDLENKLYSNVKLLRSRLESSECIRHYFEVYDTIRDNSDMVPTECVLRNVIKDIGNLLENEYPDDYARFKKLRSIESRIKDIINDSELDTETKEKLENTYIEMREFSKRFTGSMLEYIGKLIVFFIKFNKSIKDGTLDDKVKLEIKRLTRSVILLSDSNNIPRFYLFTKDNETLNVYSLEEAYEIVVPNKDEDDLLNNKKMINMIKNEGYTIDELDICKILAEFVKSVIPEFTWSKNEKDSDVETAVSIILSKFRDSSFNLEKVKLKNS